METLNHATGSSQGSSGGFVQRIIRGIAFPSGGWVFFLCLLAICGTAAFTGAVPTRNFGHDDIVPLENGWRLLCNQRPHVDYFSSWGPVMFFPAALGLALSNASANALGYGSAILGLLVGLWGYRLGRARLENIPHIFFALLLALLVTAPYVIGASPLLSTHAMAYNRFGFALVALVLLECLQREDGDHEDAGEFTGGLSTGMAMALALFLKASYFTVAVAIVLLSFALRRLNWRRLGGLALGFGLPAFVLLAYMDFDVLDFVHDLQIAAYAGSRFVAVAIPTPAEKLVGQMPALVLLIVLLLYLRPGEQRAKRWIEAHDLFIWGPAVFLANLILLMSNMQKRGAPLLAVFAIVVVSRMWKERGRAGLGQTGLARQDHFMVFLLCGVLSVPQFCFDAAGLGYGALQKAHPSAVVRFNNPRLASLILYEAPSSPQANGRGYTSSVNDGLDLLKQHCKSTDGILTMDMVNPFPYALGWTPPHGRGETVPYSALFAAEPTQSDRDFFEGATVVMVPKAPGLPPSHYELFFRSHIPGLLQQYRLTAESKSWWLYKLK